MDVAARLRKIIADELGRDEREVVDTAGFEDDLGADSMALVELRRAVEAAFDLKIPDGDVERLKTVGQAVAYIKTALGEAAPPPATTTAADVEGKGAVEKTSVHEGKPAATGVGDETVYKVVVNHEEQYSIWPANREPALGWRPTGKQGTKDECLAHIKEVWTDMRPLSVRRTVQGD